MHRAKAEKEGNMTFLTRMDRALLSCAIVVLLFSTPGIAAGRELVIFGDSLSDPGNYFAETGEFVQAPYEPVPGAPYTIGGFHFSNGRTWIEQLASELHTPRSAGPAVRSPGVFTNYAFGRARARVGATYPLFDLSWQVETYVIWFGGNDVRDALAALAEDPSGATSGAIIQAALGAIADNIVELHSAGARSFLVLNAPNIGVLPAVRALGVGNPAIPVIAEQLSVVFNAGLTSTLDSLQVVLPAADFVRLDTFSLINDIIADPEGSGLTDVNEPCLTFGVVAGAVCALPNGHLFWDGAHPTNSGHGLVADAALEALSQP
jgi:phospholipase/lecithinase/hemolysin